MMILVDAISEQINAEVENVRNGDSGDSSHLDALHTIYNKVSAAWIRGDL